MTTMCLKTLREGIHRGMMICGGDLMELKLGAWLFNWEMNNGRGAGTWTKYGRWLINMAEDGSWVLLEMPLMRQDKTRSDSGRVWEGGHGGDLKTDGSRLRMRGNGVERIVENQKIKWRMATTMIVSLRDCEEKSDKTRMMIIFLMIFVNDFHSACLCNLLLHFFVALVKNKEE